MNKIYSALALMLVAFFAVACSDKENVETTQTAVKVLKSQTYLTANGDSGYIVLQAPVVKAESHADWLATSIKGDSVYLIPQPNSAITGRSTRVTLTNKQGAVAVVSVSQEGLIFEFKKGTELLALDADTTATYKLVSNLPIEVKADKEWISVNHKAGKLSVKLEKNTTGIPRFGHVLIESKGIKDTIRVMQADKDDLLGQYSLSTLKIAGTAKPTAVKLPIQFQDAKGDTISMLIQNTYTLKGVYKGGGVIEFKMGQTILTRTNASGATSYFKVAALSKKGAMFYDSTALLTIKLNEKGRFVFLENGTVPDNILGGWAILLFKAEKADPDDLAGVVEGYRSFYFTRN